jgi:hypothetical protein
LGEVEGMRELYLRGVSVETVLANTACASEPVMRDFVLLPETLNGLLVQRLLETPDEPGLNRQLFSYLADKASEAVFRDLIDKAPGFLGRAGIASWRAAYDPKVRTYARAQSLNLLPVEFRDYMASTLENDLFDALDVSFLDNENILQLFSVSTLLGLIARIKGDLISRFEANIDTCQEEADLDIEPSDNFDDISSSVSELVTFLEDKDTEAHESAQYLLTAIDHAVEKVAERKDERQRERERDEWMWSELSDSVRPPRSDPTVVRSAQAIPSASPNPRSIFSDVDQ